MRRRIADRFVRMGYDLDAIVPKDAFPTMKLPEGTTWRGLAECMDEIADRFWGKEIPTCKDERS